MIGSTTSGEFTHEGDGNKTVSIFAVAGDYKVSAAMAVGLADDPERAVMTALEGQPGRVPADQFAAEREAVAAIWRQTMGEAV